MVHTVFCTTSRKQKNLRNHDLFAVFWLLLLSNKGQTTVQNLKSKKIIARFGVFGVHNNVFFSRVSWCLVMFEKHFTSAGLRGFLLLLCQPFLSCFGFFFSWFLLFSIFFTSSCCCFISQVSLFWLLLLLLWVSLILLCVVFWIFWFWFLFVLEGLRVRWGLFFVLFLLLVFWKGLRVRWGYPKGHFTWPRTLLMSFFWFVFGLFVVL